MSQDNYIREPDSLEILTAAAHSGGQWRSLDELASRAGLVSPLNEGDEDTGEFIDAVSRRRFLQLAAASFGLAGLTGCTRQPVETIVPYVDAPESIVPGNPQYYATAVPVAGMAQGVLVESHMGRPTKIDGNPLHPASLGASSVHAQASILDLYDPDRSKNVTEGGELRSWEEFLASFRSVAEQLTANHGAGLHILTEPITSPSLAAQLQATLAAFPQAQWHQYSSVSNNAAMAGTQAAFGRPLHAIYDFSKADVVVSLDADFLTCGEPSTRYARDFTMRRAGTNRLDMNRLYMAETTMTATGGKADHRLPLRYAEIETLAHDIAATLQVSGVTAASQGPHAQWIEAVAQDLRAHPGASIVIAGAEQPAAVHALAHSINVTLGNTSNTVSYIEPLQTQPTDTLSSLRDLMTAIDHGTANVLLILGGNPGYDAPADFNFVERLAKVKYSVRCGLHADETSNHCTWHIPESHFLEEWSDARAYDGTITILQPLINPLYDTHSPLQVIDALLNTVVRPTYDIVRAYWQTHSGAADFEQWWRRSIHDGLVANSAAQMVTPALQQTSFTPPATSNTPSLEINFRVDPYLYDGRFANNGWLQELPQPMTKLTWDNAAYVSPATAHRLNVSTHDRVELRVGERTVEGGVWVLPGQPDEAITVHLGWGRWASGRAANGAGFNANRLRLWDAMWHNTGLQMRKLDGNAQLATTQMQQTMEGRDLALAATVDEFRHKPEFAREKSKPPKDDLTLYPKWQYPGRAWGMSIDLTRCVNCNACVVACQAENNIPVVGKEQILRRRPMHWLRIDTYYEGDPANPKAHYQPVPCMQCEDAPCEVVCPVQATNHSDEGLNDMVYNRCVGTRYCSNNCPYKVRRFNFLLYQDWTTESIKLQRNPDVTVRSRGVMEKCTYCVQRIREADIQTRIEDRDIRDGEVQTACQQSCPTDAIIFGNINDGTSRVAKLKSEPLNYALLAELNTRPRTTYLAELRNPNPALAKEQA